MSTNPTTSHSCCRREFGVCDCDIENKQIENSEFNKYLLNSSLPFLNAEAINNVLLGKTKTYRYLENQNTLQNVQTTPVNDFSDVCAALKINVATFSKAQTQNMTPAIRDALDNEFIALVMFKKFLLEKAS